MSMANSDSLKEMHGSELETDIFKLVKDYSRTHEDWTPLRDLWRAAKLEGMGHRATSLLCLRVAKWALEKGADIRKENWDVVLASPIEYSEDIRLSFEGHDREEAKKFCKDLFSLVLDTFETSMKKALGPIVRVDPAAATTTDHRGEDEVDAGQGDGQGDVPVAEDDGSEVQKEDEALPRDCDSFIANMQTQILVRPVQNLMTAIIANNSLPDSVVKSLEEARDSRDKCFDFYEGFAELFKAGSGHHIKVSDILQWTHSSQEGLDQCVLDMQVNWEDGGEGEKAGKILIGQFEMSDPESLKRMSEEGDAGAQLVLEVVKAAEECPGDLGAVCNKVLEVATTRLEDGSLTNILHMLTSKLNLSPTDFVMPDHE